MAKKQKFVFATPTSGCSYLTAGKEYMVIKEDAYGFEIVDDTKQVIFCTWKNSSHTDTGTFTRKEREI